MHCVKLCLKTLPSTSTSAPAVWFWASSPYLRSAGVNSLVWVSLAQGSCCVPTDANLNFLHVLLYFQQRNIPNQGLGTYWMGSTLWVGLGLAMSSCSIRISSLSLSTNFCQFKIFFFFCKPEKMNYPKMCFCFCLRLSQKLKCTFGFAIWSPFCVYVCVF